MGRSSELYIHLRQQEVERQELADREQEFFNTRYAKDRLPEEKQPRETAQQQPKR